VIEVDGDAIDQIAEVAPAIADRGKGDRVDVVVVRNKARRRLRVALQDDVHGPGFRGDTSDAIEELRESLESLEMRVDKLDRARRRASKPKS
jgi:hypothetical protein